MVAMEWVYVSAVGVNASSLFLVQIASASGAVLSSFLATAITLSLGSMLFYRVLLSLAVCCKWDVRVVAGSIRLSITSVQLVYWIAEI